MVLSKRDRVYCPILNSQLDMTDARESIDNPYKFSHVCRLGRIDSNAGVYCDTTLTECPIYHNIDTILDGLDLRRREQTPQQTPLAPSSPLCKGDEAVRERILEQIAG